MITSISVMGITEAATVILITMTITAMRITISIIRQLHLPEDGRGNLSRWVPLIAEINVILMLS